MFCRTKSIQKWPTEISDRLQNPRYWLAAADRDGGAGPCVSAVGEHDGRQRTADVSGSGGAVCRSKDAIGTGLVSGSRRRSGEPWRAAETALSRPHGVDGVWDTVREDSVSNTVHPLGA